MSQIKTYTTSEIRYGTQGGSFVALADHESAVAAAEQRTAALLPSKVTECRECGSKSLFWFANNTVRNGIQQNRLNTNDVTCVFVLGCNDCSETLFMVSADRIAERMTAALEPIESGAADELAAT